MIKLFITCDECGYRDSSEETTREWITVSTGEKDYHFCDMKHLGMWSEKK